MTKKELERRYHFLLMKMKVINEITKEMTSENFAKKAGEILFHSDREDIAKMIKFIEEYNENYNFYNKTQSINDYLEALDGKKGGSL